MKPSSPLRRRTPLKRSPLKQKKADSPKAKARMKSKGVRAKRWAPWQREQRDLVVLRSQGRCEAPYCREAGYHWHHIFGRRNVVAEPLASWRAFTIYLCPECHDKCHARAGDGELRRHIQFRAFKRACRALGDDICGAILFEDYEQEPVAGARRVERKFRSYMGEPTKLEEHRKILASTP